MIKFSNYQYVQRLCTIIYILLTLQLFPIDSYLVTPTSSLQTIRKGYLTSITNLKFVTSNCGNNDRLMPILWSINEDSKSGEPYQANNDKKTFSLLNFAFPSILFLLAIVLEAFPSVAGNSILLSDSFDSQMFDASTFQPICPTSDTVYQILKNIASLLIGSENVAEYGPLISSVLLRIRLELCVFESFIYEAIIPFIKLKGLSWILPIHETVETLLAGSIFAIASNFILVGTTKIIAVLMIYIDALIGFPLRILGNFINKIAQNRNNIASNTGYIMKFIGDISNNIRKTLELLDTFVGRYLVISTTMFKHFDPQNVCTGAPVFVRKQFSYKGYASSTFSVEQALKIMEYVGKLSGSEFCLPFAISLAENGQVISIAEDNGEFGAGEMLANCLKKFEGYNILVCVTKKVDGMFVTEMVQNQKPRAIKEAALSALGVLMTNLIGSNSFKLLSDNQRELLENQLLETNQPVKKNNNNKKKKSIKNSL